MHLDLESSHTRTREGYEGTSQSCVGSPCELHVDELDGIFSLCAMGMYQPWRDLAHAFPGTKLVLQGVLVMLSTIPGPLVRESVCR